MGGVEEGVNAARRSTSPDLTPWRGSQDSWRPPFPTSTSTQPRDLSLPRLSESNSSMLQRTELTVQNRVAKSMSDRVNKNKKHGEKRNTDWWYKYSKWTYPWRKTNKIKLWNSRINFLKSLYHPMLIWHQFVSDFSFGLKLQGKREEKIVARLLSRKYILWFPRQHDALTQKLTCVPNTVGQKHPPSTKTSTLL